MKRNRHSLDRVVGLFSLLLAGNVHAQAAPPAPASLQDVSGCTLDGDSVFIATGRDASARRYRYAWDASIDALCNARGFAIATPAKPTVLQPASQKPARPPPAEAAEKTTSGAPVQFPADATPLSAEALAKRFSGKTFNARLHDGGRWRLQYQSNGYIFVNADGGRNASGQWRAEEGRLCADIRNGPSSCNEVRGQGERLLLKRDNGEIIALEAE